MTCISCPPECEACISKNDCTLCNSPYFLINNKCLENCPDGNYADENIKECLSCNRACNNCYGPSSKECIDCNYIDGYGKASGKVGECYLITCSDGMYLNIDEIEKLAVCLPCNNTCASCSGGGGYDCIKCADGYIKIIQSNGKTLCTTCPEGFVMTSKGKCKGNFYLNNRNLWRWI